MRFPVGLRGPRCTGLALLGTHVHQRLLYVCGPQGTCPTPAWSWVVLAPALPGFHSVPAFPKGFSAPSLSAPQRRVADFYGSCFATSSRCPDPAARGLRGTSRWARQDRVI